MSRDVSELDLYLHECGRFQVKPHAAVVIALSCDGVTYLQLDETFSAADLIPFAEVLKINETITSLDFQRCCLGSVSCYVIRDVLKENLVLKHINLNCNDIGEHGAVALAEGIQMSDSIQAVHLAHNRIGYEGACALARAMLKARSLQLLDVRSNFLRVPGVKALVDARRKCHARAQIAQHRLRQQPAHARVHASVEGIPQHVHVNFSGNLAREEIVNSLTHGLGLVLALIGVFPLMSKAAQSNDAVHYWAVAIYCATLTLMFLSCTMAHAFFLLERTARIFHVFDRVSVYFLIAGTYTPFLLVNLRDVYGAQLLLAAVWTLAILGCMLTLTVVNMRRGELTQLEVSLYMGMGWLALIGARWIWSCLAADALLLIGLGGIIYSLGVLFYVGEKDIPSAHNAWQIFLLVACGLHYFAIYYWVEYTPCVI